MVIMIQFLSQSGEHHPKHGGGPTSKQTVLLPLHPFLAFCTHYAIVISSTFIVHDYFFVDTKNENRGYERQEIINISMRQNWVSCFLFFYVIALFGARCLSSHYAGRLRQYAVLYELTWLCNSTLLIGALSFGGFEKLCNEYFWAPVTWILRRRPLVATSFCVAVSIDQVMWYVDLAVWLISGHFPVGVTKYLTWKQTLWIDRFTCTHHLWTIPLYIFGANELSIDSYLLSIQLVVVHVLLSRWLTPRCIEKSDNDACKNGDDDSGSEDRKKDPNRYRYLNVNLSHELWKDISLGFLRISDDNPPCVTYLSRLLWRWQLFNFLVFVCVLIPVSKMIINNE